MLSCLNFFVKYNVRVSIRFLIEKTYEENRTDGGFTDTMLGAVCALSRS